MFMLYFESNQGRQMYRERRYADHIYSDILQSAPFRSQIFLASGGKRVLSHPNQNPADVRVVIRPSVCPTAQLPML